MLGSDSSLGAPIYPWTGLYKVRRHKGPCFRATAKLAKKNVLVEAHLGFLEVDVDVTVEYTGLISCGACLSRPWSIFGLLLGRAASMIGIIGESRQISTGPKFRSNEHRRIRFMVYLRAY